MSENITILEQKVDIRDLKDVMHLSDTDQQALTEQLEENHGSVRLAIHLFNNSYLDEEYQKHAVPILQKAIKMNTPVIFGIRCGEDANLADFFNEHFGYAPGNFYYYRTISDDSMPYFPGCTNSVQDRGIKDDYSIAWSTFAEIFKGLGVRKLIFSGNKNVLKDDTVDFFREIILSDDLMFVNLRQELLSAPAYLGIEYFWESRTAKGAKKCNYNSSFCVGRAYRVLSKYFVCDLSHFAYPDGRGEQMKREGTLPRKHEDV